MLLQVGTSNNASLPDYRWNLKTHVNAFACVYQGTMEAAVLEKYHFTAAATKGGGFELAWEAKSIHGHEAGKGLRAAFAPHSSRKSLVISYAAKTDVQLFNDAGSQLAAVNISGRVVTCSIHQSQMLIDVCSILVGEFRSSGLKLQTFPRK